jgi:WD40 repeat protein
LSRPQPGENLGRIAGYHLTGLLGEGGQGVVYLGGVPVAITGGEDMTARVWDLTAMKPFGAPLTGHTGWVWSVAVSTLGGVPVAVTGSEDSTVRVWDLTTRKPRGSPFSGHSDCVWSVATGLLDGRPVAVSGSRDQTARVWSLGPGD